MGLRRQRNYAGRWDILIQQATQCLNQMVQIAAHKRRNYILDQVLQTLSYDSQWRQLWMSSSVFLLICYLFILQEATIW